MITKNYLKPGMLMELRNGEIVILSLSTSICEVKEIILSWNDGSGKCLFLRDYNDDLVYHDYEELSIDKVYDVGNYIEPFSMDIKNRILIWDRYKENFSSEEHVKAAFIKHSLMQLDSSASNHPIVISPLSNNRMEVRCGNSTILNLPLSENFVNLNKTMSLDDVINGKVL